MLGLMSFAESPLECRTIAASRMWHFRLGILDSVVTFQWKRLKKKLKENQNWFSLASEKI
jgi:hypothetical protein